MKTTLHFAFRRDLQSTPVAAARNSQRLASNMVIVVRNRRRRVVITIAAITSVVLLAVGAWLLVPEWKRRHEQEASRPPKPEAPPDLAKLRDPFDAGLDALQRGDGAAAVRIFSSFSFGARAVEEYRLYFLANGYQLQGDRKSARIALAQLWQRGSRSVVRNDIAFNLASLYAGVADWEHAGAIYEDAADASDVPSVAATARWQAIESRFADGDIAAVMASARDIAVQNPKAKEAGSALAIIRSLSGVAETAAVPLTPDERLDRAAALLRDGDPQSALSELDAIDDKSVSAESRPLLQLDRGTALQQLRHFDESNKLLEPLGSGAYRVAIPALRLAAKNYVALSAAVNPISYKMVVQRKQVGTIRVRVKGSKKLVAKPKYANVKTRVPVLDAAAKAKKEGLEHLAAEREQDLLQLPADDDVRIEALNALIATAEAKKENDYERELIGKLVKVDPSADVGLQRFWDLAWAAWLRGDKNEATTLLRFISDTYRNPNVKRQADYWYARTIERFGDKAGAMTIYRRLAASPYQDVYALDSVGRGAPAAAPSGTNPLTTPRDDWATIAEQKMPKELRLAYELTALSDPRDARTEIQKNMSRTNQPYADALLADLYNSSGDLDLMYRSIRRAFPQLATVEQDSVPPYFLAMYYPRKYQDEIERYSRKNGVDPFLVMGLILQESSFNPRAKSNVGATGLMQLMAPTARELARKIHGRLTNPKLDDPTTNIELGTMYFRHLVDLFDGNTQLAVASYNAGQGNVMKWKRAGAGKPMDELLESIPFPETRNYVKRVTMLSASYRRFSQ